MSKTKRITQLSSTEARKYFLDEKKYFTSELPEYISFSGVITDAINYLGNRQLYQVLKSLKQQNLQSPKEIENIDYSIISNKKSRYGWRVFELIHPVLYVGFVNDITEQANWELICDRFATFASNPKILCCSVPISDSRKKQVVSNWWNTFEQRSIALSIDYSCMGVTDIENCYPSIYTHSIPWALHTKSVAKLNHGGAYLGNRMDEYIRAMQYGQTNGIPQGSILMDFVAELVLGYSDEQITKRLEGVIDNYQILRYRDDYRIFANSKNEVEEIIKQIAIVLKSLNMSISANKTSISENIVLDSIKKDKLSRIISSAAQGVTLQKRLMGLYEFSLRYPNSGSVRQELGEIYKKEFRTLVNRPNSFEQLIGITLEIMHRNPATYNYCVGILSELFRFLGADSIKNYVSRIKKKFSYEPFSDYLEIWLQRTTLCHDRSYNYECKLCKKVINPNNENLWNSSWLDIQFDESSVIDEKKVVNISPILPLNVVDSFECDYEG